MPLHAPVAPSSEDSTDYRKQWCESCGFRQIAEPLTDNITLKTVIDSLPQKLVARLDFEMSVLSAPVAPSSEDSTDYRKQLCESCGFRQIAEPLTDNITLKTVIDSFPQKLVARLDFEMSNLSAPVAPSSEDSTDYRKQLCESCGFRQIAEPLTDNITLKTVIDSFPQKLVARLMANTAWHLAEAKEFNASPIFWKAIILHNVALDAYSSLVLTIIERSMLALSQWYSTQLLTYPSNPPMSGIQPRSNSSAQFTATIFVGNESLLHSITAKCIHNQVAHN
ncbi:hypothetical protein POM88_005736 [Heracleum sosnowskyi]|uniref:Uncharacterized protein n=1 Tax=Heracleum sosnowskyi TaxID=360622 RepID=A0AAD8J2I8_9APIA|nr:hypothetical protein POM88_005736 [Heracleum sosnowskyi]